MLRSLTLPVTLILVLGAATAWSAEDDGKSVPRADGPTAKEYPALHNLLAVTERIYSGGEPEGDDAFEALRQLGVKTIVSVDGARPDAARARKYGLRYVHIPIGYDGVGAEAGAALARVVREADAPIYVHCHHGKHRGPAAAAVACIAAGEADGRAALEILKRAGTGKEYPGLWRDVAAYRPPLAGAKAPPLLEAVEVSSLASAMARLDRAFDELRLSREADWGVPAEHPDLVPLAEATLVREQFHESARLLSGQRDARFKQWLSETEAISRELEAALKTADKPRATQSFQRLEKACKQCHAAYRNQSR